MAFYARSFSYNDQPSEIFGLIITSTDSGEGSSPTSNIEIKTQQIFRRPTPFFFGTSQNEVLSFDVSIRTTETEMTAEDAALAQEWLFSQQNYGILRIVQPDMEDYYFKCFFVDGQVVRVGNVIVGFDAKVICDSPFAWGVAKSVTYTESNKTYILLNESENNFYTYPYMVININGGLCDFLIRNVTDNNREMSVTGLMIGETVTIDNDLQIITATQSVNPLNKFASPINFFRLVSGVNE